MAVKSPKIFPIFNIVTSGVMQRPQRTPQGALRKSRALGPESGKEQPPDRRLSLLVGDGGWRRDRRRAHLLLARRQVEVVWNHDRARDHLGLELVDFLQHRGSDEPFVVLIHGCG